MAANFSVTSQFFQSVEIFSQDHFVVASVNAIVALTTDINSRLQLFARVMLFKVIASVHFAGN
jgi:hypothetical protein